MTKKRMIDTRFWHDGWIRKLNALDRYLFLYLISNDKCSFCGIYELPISIIAFETGIDERDLENSMLGRLEPKIYYREGWVYITNFKRHHVSEDSKNSTKGFDNALSVVPKHIQKLFSDIIDKPLQAPSSPSDTIASASAIAFSTDSNESDSLTGKKKLTNKKMYTYHSINEDGSPKRKRSSGKGKEVKSRNAEYINIGFLFEKMGEKSTGVKPDLSKAYFIIKNAREKLDVQDFEGLFTHFFANQKLTPEQKVSLAFCCSPSYITQWKVSKQNKVISQVEASADIEL